MDVETVGHKLFIFNFWFSFLPVHRGLVIVAYDILRLLWFSFRARGLAKDISLSVVLDVICSDFVTFPLIAAKSVNTFSFFVGIFFRFVSYHFLICTFVIFISTCKSKHLTDHFNDHFADRFTV